MVLLRGRQVNSHNKKTHLIFGDIYSNLEKLEIKGPDLPFGPRRYTLATKQLQNICNALLDPLVEVVNFNYNLNNELEVYVLGKIINVTQLFQHNPNYEQLAFSHAQLKKYAAFVLDGGVNWPVDIYNISIKRVANDLHVGELIAIRVYTFQSYEPIQEFLRNDGKLLKKMSSEELNLKAKELLLCICIASRAISKPAIEKNILEPEKKLDCHRFESADHKSPFMSERTMDAAKNSLRHKGFTSTGYKFSFFVKGTNCFTVFSQENGSNAIGLYIKEYSSKPVESEFLFAAGTTFQYTDYREIDGYFYFACRPVQTINDEEDAAYTLDKMHFHELDVIEKYFEKFLADNKPSPVTNFFAVTNGEALQCIVVVSRFIKAIKSEIVSTARLTELRNVIVDALTDHEALVTKAKLEFLLKKSGLLLKEALGRVNNMIIDRNLQSLAEGPERNLSTPAIFDIPKVLTAIKNKLLAMNTLTITPDLIHRIKELREYCNKKYYQQSFYGNAALNRKMLLDKEIAGMLAPRVLLAIFNLQQKNPSDPLLLIKRDSTGTINIADAIFYGFDNGMEVIRFMPNNEPRFTLDLYVQQQQNYLDNTEVIAVYILKAAELLGIDLLSKKFLIKLQDRHKPLSQRFAEVCSAINKIAEAKKSNELLSVPGYSPSSIRNQCISGFAALCSSLRYPLEQLSNDQLKITKVNSLVEFVAAFLASNDTILNGSVGHLFYDRAHFEACLEQNTTIYIGKQGYKFFEILGEMVKQAEVLAKPSVAYEQMNIRLRCVEQDLKIRFSGFYDPQPFVEPFSLRMAYVR